MDERYKEAYFNLYCEKCEHKDVPEKDGPCDECLEQPINLYSHKPVNYKEKD